MLDLNDFCYFVEVVDRGGFTAAARNLRMPKSTLSYRIGKLESQLGVRLLNRTSRQFAMTDAGGEFYRHAIEMLDKAEQAETAIRHRLVEPAGTVRYTTGTATAQFAMCGMVADFLFRFPKVNLVGDVTDRTVDIVRENFDVAIRAHSGPLPDSTLIQRTLAPVPCFLFAGSDYMRRPDAPKTPQDLAKHPSLFMLRGDAEPVWRVRNMSKDNEEVVIPTKPRLMISDMIGLKQAAIAGMGIVSLPGYICRDDVKSGALQPVLPGWLAGDATISALVPTRQGLLPSVRAFLAHIATEFPKVVTLT